MPRSPGCHLFFGHRSCRLLDFSILSWNLWHRVGQSVRVFLDQLSLGLPLQNTGRRLDVDSGSKELVDVVAESRSTANAEAPAADMVLTGILVAVAADLDGKVTLVLGKKTRLTATIRMTLLLVEFRREGISPEAVEGSLCRLW